MNDECVALFSYSQLSTFDSQLFLATWSQHVVVRIGKTHNILKGWPKTFRFHSAIFRSIPLDSAKFR